jgi:hypothetical protein
LQAQERSCLQRAPAGEAGLLEARVDAPYTTIFSIVEPPSSAEATRGRVRRSAVYDEPMRTLYAAGTNRRRQFR